MKTHQISYVIGLIKDDIKWLDDCCERANGPGHVSCDCKDTFEDYNEIIKELETTKPEDDNNGNN